MLQTTIRFDTHRNTQQQEVRLYMIEPYIKQIVDL